MNGDDLIQMGLDGLASLAREHGFDASDAESGLYPALYGRDSLWVLLLLQAAVGIRRDERVEALLATAGPRILTSLAAIQGSVVNDLVEEQPGKIPHEYHAIPSPHAVDSGLPLDGGRSFAGFDETFLFVLAYDAFVASHPRHPVSHDLAGNVERALDWIATYTDEDGDGLFEYTRRNPANLLNEVWKDSFDSATHTGFDVPAHPLAWLEIQGYGYAVAASRDPARADHIAQLVDDHFWLGDDASLAMALDAGKLPIRMAGSNAGHALWSGVVRPDRIEHVIRRLTRADIFSTFGLRTLSRTSPYYAPFAYHRGAVWPFDNAVCALGLLRCGRADLALEIANAVGRAVTIAQTPVECYVVLEPEELMEPVSAGAPLLCWHHWPVRNRVQAFTAAAVVVFGALIAEA